VLVVNSSIINRAMTRQDIRAVMVPGNEIAEELGDRRMTNMVLLGGCWQTCRCCSLEAELIENAEYEAAKNEQAFVEGRIKELEILLATARVIDEGSVQGSGLVQVGSTVTIKEEDLEPEIYTIVGAAEANPVNGRISNESPLGKALLNRKEGDRVQVDAPAGSFIVNILKVE
jgi:transcription elongation factor GreA